MKLPRLLVTGLSLASLGLSAGASAQGWASPRLGPGPAIGRDAPPPSRFVDRRFDERGLNNRRFDDRRFDDRRFDDRGRGRWSDRDRDRRWGRDDRRWGRGDDRCWVEYRRGGRVTVCR